MTVHFGFNKNYKILKRFYFRLKLAIMEDSETITEKPLITGLDIINEIFHIKISDNFIGNVTGNMTGPPPCVDPPLEVSEAYLVRSGISFLIFCGAIVGNIFVLYPLIRNFKRHRFFSLLMSHDSCDIFLIAENS